MDWVSVLPQTEQERACMPVAVQVAAWVVVHAPKLWMPVAGMISWAVSVAPQVAQQEPSVTPLYQQVA